MPNTKISADPAASVLDGTELLAGVQGGVNKKITPAQIAAYVSKKFNFEYAADTAATSDADPGAGKLRWNNATQASATQLYINLATSDSVTITTLLDAMKANSRITIFERDNPDNRQVFKLTADAITATGYRKLSVSLMASEGSSISDTSALVVQIDLAGATGQPFELQFAVSDESTALTAGTAKITLRVPRAFTLTEARASLTVAQASGSILTINIKKNGTTIFSTKITIDNTEKTSVTAVTQPVLSTTSFADDDEITVDIDQVGDGTAKGLKITMLGTR